MKKKYTLEELNALVERNKGGYLYLSGLTSIPEGFNPTVGGYLYLRGLTSIPEGFNPTVGGYLDLRGLTSKYTSLKNGDYKAGKYLYADEILTHIKRTKKIGKYTFYIGKIPGKNVVFDGENYAHCNSFTEGVNDLNFKATKERGAEQYKDLTLESVLTVEDAKTMYRVITGACKQGTQSFVDSLGELKDTYTIKEIVELTKGHYGASTFANFFKSNN